MMYLFELKMNYISKNYNNSKNIIILEKIVSPLVHFEYIFRVFVYSDNQGQLLINYGSYFINISVPSQ